MKEKPQNNFFWSIEKEEIAKIFQTDLSVGISNEQAEERLKKFGFNVFGEAKKFSKFKILLSQFKSPLIFILIIAGIATLFLKEWFDAFIIFLAIFVNAGLGFYQENKAENALAHLRSYIQQKTRVIRSGKEIEIDVHNVVIGDLVHLSSGDRVPADCRVIFENELSVDESILTGESLSVQKDSAVLSEATLVADRKNMVFGGTLVTEGKATVIVVAVGKDTEIGKIADLVIETEQERTPLQKAVSKLAWVIAFALSFIVAGVFALGIYRGEPIFDMFLMSIAVAVGAIPEALPIGLTAVLAVGVQRLAQKKGIMRNLAAAETLGSTSVIMTDKTGTLTEAKMSLVDIFTLENLLSADLINSKKKDFSNFSLEQKEILLLSSMNTDVLIENEQDNPNDWKINGNALESNIVKSSALNNLDIKTFKKDCNFEIVLPFNSKNKFSISLGHVSLQTKISGRKNGPAFVFLGAPDIILKKSKMDKNEYLQVLQNLENLSNEGKRILGVAVKNIPENFNHKNIKFEEVDDLTFVGILAFYDPIRKTVPGAIKQMTDYGVKVVMATGDLKGTASAVARNIGFKIGENEVLSGDEIRQMSDEELMKSLDLVKVFARVTPEDKLRIAKLYQKRGEVVAMTGDGVNDAPSLKAVDIGIAVGSGTDVAKGVSDLVLLDNNFETIVSAIEEGKLMLRNIRKIFVYLMSNSLDEVILIGGSLILNLALPLTAVQIIWVNFFTGSLPAVAFAFDNEKYQDLGVSKKHTEKKVFNNQVKFLTIAIGLFNASVLFFTYWFLMNKTDFDPLKIKTFIFACFSSYILFVAFSLRGLSRPIFSYNIFSNKFLVYGVIVGLILLSITIYTPFLHGIFGTTALGLGWVIAICVWIIITVSIVEFAKWIFYRRQEA
ncbi:MAG TPA: cation-transporting P-type ATPase [Candidatus Paceibacterota bacterium]|nr:cation-transporting P-type ATPase [Candidatus Paceibacterota bacterium]